MKTLIHHIETSANEYNILLIHVGYPPPLPPDLNRNVLEVGHPRQGLQHSCVHFSPLPILEKSRLTLRSVSL